MKHILIVVICLSFTGVFSQDLEDKDKWARAAMASYNEAQFSLDFQTPYGMAAGNVLLKAYRALLAFPDIPVNNIPVADRAKYEQLLSQLQQLRNNPPDWNTIVALEAEQHKAEFAPPTAPVFAGDQNAKVAAKYKHMNRHSSGVTGKNEEGIISK